jgi:outer membrane lipoprotein-sorting protein
MTMTMRARTYRLAAPDGRSKTPQAPTRRAGEGFSLGAAKVWRYPGSQAYSSHEALNHGRAVMNILRRLPLPRLLLVCALVAVLGGSLAAIALALGSGPTPPPKPLAQAVHDALSAAPVEGVSANVTLTDHLLEGASLTSAAGESGSQLSSSPLLSGATGRLWVAKDGRVRLELQAEKGDTQVLYDGHTLTVYDASSNTLYRFTPPAGSGRECKTTSSPSQGASSQSTLMYCPDMSKEHEVPSVAKIEEAIAKLDHVNVSGATPTNVAGQPAYTARVSPKEGGSLLGGAEVSWDADNGLPLRAALYSSASSSPVIELAATEVSFGPVDGSVFEFTPPASAKVEEVKLSSDQAGKHTNGSGEDHGKPNVTTHGRGVSSVAVVESKLKPGEKAASLPEGLPKVKIDGTTTATELPTALGTLLSFERSGVRYVLAGAVTPADIEAVARGL